MNWLREHKSQVRSAIIGTIMVGAVLLAITGNYLYRKRVLTENIIAERYRETLSEPQGAVETETELKKTASEICLDELDTVVWNGKTYKQNPYIKAILVMGVDRMDEMTETKELGDAGQADGIFLIAQDTARNRLKILMIPRDTMTEVNTLNPDGTEGGKKQKHLTLAFAHGDGMYDSCENVVEAVSDLLFGLPIDHYFASDIAVIADLNDAVGGVTVTVPSYGMEKVAEQFKAGEQVTLYGTMAEKFVRYRDCETDNSALYRMNQQKEYITQYFSSLKNTSKTDSQIIDKLFGILENHMLTDMTKDEYLKLALDMMTGDGIGAETFSMLPGTGSTTEAFDEFYVNESETLNLVLELFYREIG